MLGQLTAGVAHDFNNLLLGIRIFARQGIAESADETLTSYFQEIDSATQRAAALTRSCSLSAASKTFPSGRRPERCGREPFFAVAQLSPRHQLQTALSPQPVIVLVDPSQLEQVLVNLVVNSRDAIDVHRIHHRQHRH